MQAILSILSDAENIKKKSQCFTVSNKKYKTMSEKLTRVMELPTKKQT